MFNAYYYYSLLILAVFVQMNAATVWDGITPWYTGSKCNCNGYSNRCYFDQNLYERTGHGGHCLDCTADRDGPNCERCRENYFMREDGYCIACDCSPIGSRRLQCNGEGKCECKPGVAGDKCNRCDVNHYGFTREGCKSCGCLESGSMDNQPRCNPYTGSCYCKENVEGKQCRECKPGFFNLDANNKFGCIPCFCYGHSAQCKSTPGYFEREIITSFSRNSEHWKTEDQFGRIFDPKYDSQTQSISSQGTLSFVAPNQFLGDQKSSYNQLLEFSLKGGDNLPVEVIMEGGGRTITNTITSKSGRYGFQLHEHPFYGWQPTLSSRQFISLLSNLTSIKIKGVGFLKDVKLDSASRASTGDSALWIETCNCPNGYIGQFCESCASGFRHFPALGGPHSPCIPCDCNNHASVCLPETGRCICQQNTAGENCELCARGYYGNALVGTPNDCLPCECPNGGACMQVDENLVMCTECPVGYTGHRCDSCSDGYYGDPSGKWGPSVACKLCECNGNVDPNAVGNCNTTNGKCLKCIHGTHGSHCEACLPGYYGDALTLPKGNCKRCECYPPGTEEDENGRPLCDRNTGACHCKSHVINKNCDKCENGYYSLHGGTGCQACNCDPIGSLNRTCDVNTGQCHCTPGVTGLRCDRCELRSYGFSTDGCKSCDCDTFGSRDLQCDNVGRCACLDNVEGSKCDRCKENKHDKKRGCIDCPDCYNLIRNAVKKHSLRLDEVNNTLGVIQREISVVSDEDFTDELEEIGEGIEDFFVKVKNSLSEVNEIKNIAGRKLRVSKILSGIDANVATGMGKITTKNIQRAEAILDEIEENINELVDAFEIEGKSALEEARKKSNFLGQQSIKTTIIAKEARDFADKLDAQAETIVTSTKEAKAKAVTAYEKLKISMSQQSLLSDDLRNFKSDIYDLEAKLNKTKDHIKDVSEKAAIANRNALALLSEVQNFRVPDVGVIDTKLISGKLKDEANRIRGATDELIEQSEGLRSGIDTKINLSKRLMQEALQQQNEINEAMNDLVLYESQAKVAINLWSEILEGAETNYKLLTEFDTQTQKYKQESDEALHTIVDIESSINTTNEIINKTETYLHEAKKNANLALEKALQANDLAKEASRKAEEIKSEAEILYKNSTALGEEAGLMFDRVLNTEGELKNLVEQTRSNESLINEAKERVGRAGKDTTGVAKKVQALLDDVEGIMLEIRNSPEIDDQEIDKLEEEIGLTEQKLKEAKLEERLESLQKEHKMKNDLINEYKLEIARLQKDVENIKRIIEMLPNGCFKRVELEP